VAVELHLGVSIQDRRFHLEANRSGKSFSTLFQEAILDFYKNCFSFSKCLLAETMAFKASNLLISLPSFEIRQKRDGVALNLLLYLSVAVSLFLEHPPSPIVG
jgi:hypothetical protein